MRHGITYSVIFFRNTHEKKSTMAQRMTATTPADLTDPVALRTSWAPANAGGFSVRGSKLVEVSPGRMEFHPTLINRAFGIGFLIIGFGAMFAPGPLLVKVMSAIAFSGVGIVSFYQASRKVAFDSVTGKCQSEYPYKQDEFPLADIHAIQIVSEAMKVAEASGGYFRFHSFETNLVLKTGQRVNVSDHGNLDAVRADADSLATFLGVPVWDATFGQSFHVGIREMFAPIKPKRTKSEEIMIFIAASCFGGVLGFMVGATLGTPEFGFVAGTIVVDIAVLALLRRDRE